MSQGQRRPQPARRRAPAHKRRRTPPVAKRRQGTPSTKRRQRVRLRRRVPVLVALLIAGVVLATSMPVSALLTQRRELATTSAALSRAQTADRALSAQAKALDSRGTVSGLARTDYGLVPPGTKAYVILPPQGAPASAVANSGHVPLDGPPVVPGSERSRQLLGLAGSGPSTSAGAKGSHRSAPVSFWSRVARTLEFWH